MAVFEYSGILIGSGKPTKGTRDAENAKALRALLRKEGILLTVAAEGKAAEQKKGKNLDLLAFTRRPRTQDVADFTRQLATLVGAGIPLFESLSALVEQAERDSVRTILQQVREKIREGQSFAKALEGYPKVFPPLYVNMVRAGEASGTLEPVLVRLTKFLESQAKLKGKVTSALVYPAVMCLIGGFLVSFLMVAVVPNVESIFSSMGETLPWYTSLLLATSRFVSGYWWLILLSFASGLWAFFRWKKKPEGRLKWDTLTLRLPVFGKMYRKLAIARFARTLATLLASGVALLTAMDIVRSVLGNAKLEEVVATATSSIREGQSIAEPLKKSGQFPPIVTHMIATGEKSGQLVKMLEDVSDAFDAEVETAVAAAISLLEPLIIVVMGGGVAFIAMAILMPLIQMSSFAG